MSNATLEKPRHFVDAAARLDVLRQVYGSDAAVAKLLGVDRSQPRRWREGQLPDPNERQPAHGARDGGRGAERNALADHENAETAPGAARP